MTAWWPCFVCASEDACAHREPELAMWMRERAARPMLPIVPLPPPKPPARELFDITRRKAAAR